MVAGIASGTCGVALTGGPIPSTTVTVVCVVVSGMVAVLAGGGFGGAVTVAVGALMALSLVVESPPAMESRK